MGNHLKPDRNKAQTDTNLYLHQGDDGSDLELNGERDEKEKDHIKLQHAKSEMLLCHRFFSHHARSDSLHQPRRNVGMPHLPVAVF